MGGLQGIVTFIRLIIYRCTNMGKQCVTETTYKCLSSNALVCKKSETCLYYFAPDRAEEWKASSRVTCSYYVECIIILQFPIMNIHPGSEPYFLIARGLLQNMRLVPKVKGVSLNLSQHETLLPCRRKMPWLEYVGRSAGRFVWLKSKGAILRKWE